ncbi:MAG: signal recognition particle-docking protein FtsY [Sphaerochaeta sp.]
MKLKGFGARLKSLFGISTIDETYFEELEELLIEGDLGSKLTLEISDEVRELIKKKKHVNASDLQVLVKEQLTPLVHTYHPTIDPDHLNVFLILGVNGVGKTTTIAKIAKAYKDQGLSVTLAAADTFRAAAIDQLEIHANRLGVRIVKQTSGSDPGAVVYDALSSAQARGDNVLLIDTAGRMHNKENLVRELAKIDKIVQTKGIDSDHYKKFLVIDSTTGQNGLSQATIFHQAVSLDALILSKYDSLAKGGSLIQIGANLGLPISFVGVGERYEDLELFDKERFLNALVGLA